MAISGVDPKCYILALFVRDDGTRFLLGDDPFEFKDNQLHFQPNTIANDVVEVQGNDGYLLAGQVRRPGSQSFDGYVGNGTNSKAEVEAKRRDFLQFFRRSHFYKVIYVFPNGTAIQRKQGFLVDDPTVQELYQQYPEYHVALNFEDVNYYTYEEDDQGHEIYAEEAIIRLVGGGATGGLIWDENGVVWENPWGESTTVSGTDFQVNNLLPVRVPISEVELQGDTYQQTYSGANLYNYTDTVNVGGNITTDADGWITATYNNTSGTGTHYENYFTGLLQLVTNTNYRAILEVKNVSGTGRISAVSDNAQAQFQTSDYRRFNELSNNTIYAFTTTTKTDFAGCTSSLRTVVSWSTGESGSITFRLSLLADTSVTPETFVYQPYTGGVPSPNPDYPQAVQTVTGEQTVEVHGKNLIDNTDTTYDYSNVGATYNTLTSLPTGIRYHTTYPNGSPVVVFKLLDMTPYIGKVVRMKANFGTKGRITITRCNSSLTSRTGVANTTTSGEEISYTIPSDLGSTSYLAFSLTVLNATGDDTVDYTDLIMTIDNSDMTYEPYQSQSYTVDLGSTELCKIGDYQDYVYKSGADWYVHKATTKYVYSDSSQTAYFDSSFPRASFNRPSGIVGIADTAYCNQFIYGNTENTNNSFNYSTTRVFVRSNEKMTSAADWNSWMGQNPVIFYFALSTATDTKITDETLVGQLEALDAMRLFIGENNILVSATSPNLPATLEFSYYTQYLTPYGAEWEEGGTKGPTIVDVNAIDNTYPVWELTGPAINPTLSVLTTNTTLTYNGTITASQTLVIDMFNKTATLNGTSVIGNISGDWVYMAPGTNRVAYTAGNTDAPDSKISWQEVVG